MKTYLECLQALKSAGAIGITTNDEDLAIDDVIQAERENELTIFVVEKDFEVYLGKINKLDSNGCPLSPPLHTAIWFDEQA